MIGTYPSGKTMRSSWVLVIAALVIASCTANANTTVDFSGTWVIDPNQSHQVRHFMPIPHWDKPKLETTPPTFPGVVRIERYPDIQTRYLTLLITQRPNELQINCKFKPPKGTELMITQTFALDGSQTRNPMLFSRGEFIAQTKWERDTLVITGKQVDRGTELIVREEYSLSADGKKLTVMTSSYYRANAVNDPNNLKRNDPRWDATFKQVFKRQ